MLCPKCQIDLEEISIEEARRITTGDPKGQTPIEKGAGWQRAYRCPKCQRLVLEGGMRTINVTNVQVHCAGMGCSAFTTLAVGDEPGVQMSLFLDPGWVALNGPKADELRWACPECRRNAVMLSHLGELV